MQSVLRARLLTWPSMVFTEVLALICMSENRNRETRTRQHYAKG